MPIELFFDISIAKLSMIFIAFITSLSEAVSTGECMYLQGMLIFAIQLLLHSLAVCNVVESVPP